MDHGHALTQIYEETENFGFPDLTPAQVAYAADLAASLGVPDSFTFRTDKLLPAERRAGEELATRPTARASTTSSTSTAGPIFGALFAALQNA